MEDMDRTEWTKLGYRVTLEPDGSALMFTVESQYLTEQHDGVVGLDSAVASHLIVPPGTQKREALAIVGHWASFFGDVDLTSGALDLLEKGFAVPEISYDDEEPSGNEGLN